MNLSSSTRPTRPHVGFVLEQTLGHITHSNNLQHLVPSNRRLDATFCPIEFETGERLRRVPGWSNWTVRAGIRARVAVRRLERERPVDALFVHSQVPAVLMARHFRRVPGVVSIDATPMQYDELGEHYTHATGGRAAERVKWRLNRSCFAAAAGIVSWSEWAKSSLVSDYGVPADKVTVIPPGVNRELWDRPDGHPGRGGPVRILFVGGDLARKGGLDLMRAFAELRTTHADVELHLVTKSEVAPMPGVVVHRNLSPNSPELVDLYHRADVFCLPTLGDCLPMVLSEAGAASLPLVSTAVGAIPEIVIDGETGFVVPPEDPASLVRVLDRLVANDGLRRRLGSAARDHVRDHFDARNNTDALVDLLVGITVGGAHDR